MSPPVMLVQLLPRSILDQNDEKWHSQAAVPRNGNGPEKERSPAVKTLPVTRPQAGRETPPATQP